MFKTQLLILVSFCTINLMAQKGSIIGTVLNSSTGKPIEYASVGVYKSTDSSVVNGGITNLEGKFEILEISRGDYYIEVDFLGFEKLQVNDIHITGKNPVSNLGEISLKEGSTQLEEVAVVAERNIVDYKIDKKVVNITKDIASAGGTAARALENVPSIELDTDGNVQLRGSTSYTVLINGKPTSQPGPELLKQLPASQIESIEIITNPSAKFDPDGETGIINIIMKKGFGQGFSGYVSITDGKDKKSNYTASVSYGTDKYRVYLDGQYMDMHHLREINQTTHLYDSTSGELTRNYLSNSNSTFHNHPKSVGGGVDYYLSDKTTLSLSYKVWERHYDRLNESRITDNDFLNDTTYYLKNQTNSFTAGDFTYDFNASMKHKFGKNHELTTAFLTNMWRGRQTNEIFDYHTDEHFDEVYYSEWFRSIDKNQQNNYWFKVDYTRPFENGHKLETGYQLSLVDRDADYSYHINDPEVPDTWLEIDSLFQNVVYHRSINSVYGTYSLMLPAKVNVKAGVRVEYVDRFNDQKTIGQKDPYQKLDFFPSLHLSKEFPKKHTVQLSYSRRIRRPLAHHLNSFRQVFDRNNAMEGNPDLEPEFVNSTEFNYIKKFDKGFFSAEVYYRFSENAVTRLPQHSDGVYRIYKLQNLNKRNNFGSEASFNYEAFKWWKINLNGNLVRTSESGVINGVEKSETTLSSGVRFGNNWILPWAMRIQANFFYRPRSKTLTGVRKEAYFHSLGLSQNLLKNKLTLSVNTYNLFFAPHFGFENHEPYSTDSYTFKGEVPYLEFTVRYNFNNFKGQRGAKFNSDDLGNESSF